MTNPFTAYDSTTLPAVVVAYLDAHDNHRAADALRAFTSNAVVTDDGTTYRGADEISAWLRRSASEYEYTSTRIGQCGVDTRTPIVQIRLDGNFPGGTVTLRYEFELDEDLIAGLTISA